MKKIYFLLSVFLFALLCFQTGASAMERKVLLFELNGTIHNGTFHVLKEIFNQTHNDEYECIVIALDTPGGLLDATRDIVKLMLNSYIPTVVYVSPSGSRAGSAGTFITLAANIAAMAPGTNIGAAHPVFITGGDPEKSGGRHLAKKIENDTAAFIETIAVQRNRNVEWAKSAVIESSSITEEKALELKVIDVIAADINELMSLIDGKEYKVKDKRGIFHTKDAVVERFEMDVQLRIKNFLASPSVLFALILAVILGIYLEVTNPGTFIPAAIAGIALILILFASSIVPVNYFGFLLILASAALFILEIYITSFGLLTLGGIILFIIGSSMLFDPKEVDLAIPLRQIAGAAASIGIFALFAAYKVVKTYRQHAMTGSDAMIGEEVSVVEPITKDRKGKVFVKGEYWNAVSEDNMNIGDKGTVKAINGLLLEIEKVISL